MLQRLILMVQKFFRLLLVAQPLSGFLIQAVPIICVLTEIGLPIINLLMVVKCLWEIMQFVRLLG